MKHQLDWEVFRYVLADPTLDVADFESRMSNDVDLALAVAAAVGQVEKLRQVCEYDPQPLVAVALRSHDDMQISVGRGASLPASVAEAVTGWHWMSTSLLAAGLMLAIGATMFSLRLWRDASVSNAVVRADSQVFVDTWLAFQQASLADELRPMLTEDDGVEQVGWSANEQTAAGDDVEVVGEDWMLEAAREFYAQGVAG